MTTRLNTKIFIGIQLTPELRMHLNKSTLWKQAQFDSPLKEIQASGKDYLGLHIHEDIVSLEVIKKLEASIRNQLEPYCNVDKFPIQIFSQIFIE